MLVAILAAAAAVLPPPVSGDFDRDGVADMALVAPTKGGFHVIIRRGGPGLPEATIAILNARNVTELYLSKAPAGAHATACAKDLGRATDLCAVRSVTVSGDTLQFGTAEASRAVAVWKDNQFQVVWLSD